MGRVVVTEYVTLDGVMEDPGGGDNTEHGGWSFRFWNDEAAKFKFEELFASDALLLGRLTYEGFAKAWPTVTDEAGFADRMNSLPKYVVSTTLDKAEWNNTTIIREHVAEAVERLKQQHSHDILVAGSRALVQTLMRHDLVDEYRLMTHPVVLGGGKRLFEEGSVMKTLRLVETRPLNTGIVILTYAPAEASA
jgi:dihydrofolate reductase